MPAFNFMTEFEIGGRKVGGGEPCILVAEIGPNHNGDPERAMALVEAAAEAGCDAVKFQYRIAMTFLGLLHGAKALIGNSSGGIIEAPYFHLPFILVGRRQEGREMAANVIRAETNRDALRAALAKAETPEFHAVMAADDQPFGDGKACERIYRVLKETELGPTLFRKKITY